MNRFQKEQPTFRCRYCQNLVSYSQAGLLKHEAHCAENPNKNIRVSFHNHIGVDGYQTGENYRKGGNK